MNIQHTDDIYGWQLAEVLVNRRALFVLWAVKTMFCTRVADFLYHYKITQDELMPMLKRLTIQGFLQQDGENYVLTELGDRAVSYLGELDISEFAHPERLSTEVTTRFESVKQAELQTERSRAGDTTDVLIEDLHSRNLEVEARFWAGREQQRGMPEATLVELPFIQQLVGLGWEYLPGDTGASELTHRHSFREVLLEKHLREVLPEINRDEDTKQVWLDEPRIEQAINSLKRIFTSYTSSLMGANEEATKLLQQGVPVRGTQQLHQGRNQVIRFIDFERPERNHFLVISQFRVDLAGARYIVPDIVLFVNGIPLVVVECKSPALTNPVEEGITQLLRYSGQIRHSEVQEDNEAAPDLFYFNQLLIATCFFQARFAPVGATYEHFHEWKDPYPLDENQLARNLHTTQPGSQQILVQGMLLPANLLDLLYNFTLFREVEGRKIKLVAHYHQFRAVQKAILRLYRPTRRQHGEEDQRSGIIWHTQGSGKSLTMVFLVRKMRTIGNLRDFKIIFVTDRTELERQLRETAHLTEETPHTVTRIEDLEPELKPEGSNLIFAMIQKYQGRQSHAYRVEADEDAYDASEDEADEQDDVADPHMQKINPRENILVIVDEGHRSQARKLHANLRKALPNCARIAFTGTPIIVGKKKKTHEIFGPFIDEYTIKQSELDGATLPILYEGRETYIEVTQRGQLDEQHEKIIRPLSQEIRESLRERYETYREVLEAQNLIEAKAEDMLSHYAANILPNGFKAMVVAVSRLAAIRYRDALEAAQKKLIIRLDQLPPEQRDLPEEQFKHLHEDEEIKKLIRAYPYRETLARLEFAAIVSHDAKDLTDDRVDWKRWTNEDQNEQYIKNFLKPLSSSDPTNSDGASPLAFLCVRSMLITGFDAPIVQALYLDRSIKDHELLQAIARVNRVYADKTGGLVVDYFGIARNLKEALNAYSENEVQGALTSIKDELPLLADRHRRVLAIFQAYQVSIQDVESCVRLLKELKIRADFEIKFKKFMQSMDFVLPRPEALPYIEDAQQLGLINRAAAVTYRDEQLNLISIGNKVRRLIDEHIEALKIRQLVEPISILDEDFERKLRRHTSDENNAAAMEHYARAYIEYHFKQEDPAYYQKLSERLDAILQSLYENWSQRLDALEAFIKQARQPRRIDFMGLDPRTERPFLGILEEETRKGSRRFAIPVDPQGNGRVLSDAELLQLAELTRHIVQLIRSEIVNNDDFWLTSENQERLRREIGRMLEIQGQRLLDPYTRREAVAGRLVSLAHALTSRLRNE